MGVSATPKPGRGLHCSARDPTSLLRFACKLASPFQGEVAPCQAEGSPPPARGRSARFAPGGVIDGRKAIALQPHTCDDRPRARFAQTNLALWYALRDVQLGASFRRQHPVGPYVFDFYCPSARLAIELDGDDYATRTESDSRRTRFLNQRGIRVVRFSNRDVLSNLRGVKEFIALELGHKTPSP
ncbi:MAG: endonuclease domain-containing protein [Methyloceanibacter sp.]